MGFKSFQSGRIYPSPLIGVLNFHNARPLLFQRTKKGAKRQTEEKKSGCRYKISNFIVHVVLITTLIEFVFQLRKHVWTDADRTLQVMGYQRFWG